MADTPATPADKPSVGRITHYVTETGAHRPAIVVNLPEVAEDGSNANSAHLQVFHDDAVDVSTGVGYRPDVAYSESAEPLTWHWPERI